MRKGERWINKAGYVLVRLDNHPLFPGKTMEYEHRVKMAEHLGRKLRKGEIVHHKKAPSSNNRLSNLELKKNHRAHMQEHKKPCSPATRRKISRAKKGRPQPWATGPKGYKRSEEFKRKVSAGMKRFRAKQRRKS